MSILYIYIFIPALELGSLYHFSRFHIHALVYDICFSLASLGSQMVKHLPATQETWVQSLGWEDPLEKGYPLQYSGLENSMDCIVHGVTKSWTQLSDFHSHFLFF